MNLLHRVKLIQAETEKIREKRKSEHLRKEKEERIIIAIGRWTLAVITAIGVFGTLWILASKI